MKKKLLKIIN